MTSDIKKTLSAVGFYVDLTQDSIIIKIDTKKANENEMPIYMLPSINSQCSAQDTIGSNIWSSLFNIYNFFEHHRDTTEIEFNYNFNTLEYKINTNKKDIFFENIIKFNLKTIAKNIAALRNIDCFNRHQKKEMRHWS